jgi:hypothetical protein
LDAVSKKTMSRNVTVGHGVTSRDIAGQTQRVETSVCAPSQDDVTTAQVVTPIADKERSPPTPPSKERIHDDAPRALARELAEQVHELAEQVHGVFGFDRETVPPEWYGLEHWLAV